MAHGTPLGIAETEKRYGTQGAFMIEAGISSSYHIAKFFGLTNWIREAKPAAPVAPPKPPRMSVTDSPSAKLIPTVSPIPSPLPIQMPNISKALWPATKPAPEPKREPEPKRKSQKKRRAVDISAALTRVLTAAGLMK
jgi:hypothetical protein